MVVLKRLIVFFLLFPALQAVPAAADGTGAVHLQFFHTECRECDIVKDMLNVLTNEYFPRLVVHDYDFMVRSNYMRMVQMERTLGIDANEPVAVYVGSNYFYGLKQIQKHTIESITNGLARGGVPLWSPAEGKAATDSSDDLIIERFQSFTISAVAVAGLCDGVNPCAFATLILFITLLSSYRSSNMEIILTSLVFAAAVFITYLLLGVGIFSAMEKLTMFGAVSRALQWGITLLCVVFAGLSIRDAWQVHRNRHDSNLLLSLPAGWRRAITRLLSRYVGHTRWLLGVFGVGVVVSLVESVCTGQVYLPTIAFILRTTEHRSGAFGYLILYNGMFIVPIIVLAGMVLAGVHSQRLLAWQNRNAVVTRLVMAGLFAGLALLLVITGIAHYF